MSGNPNPDSGGTPKGLLEEIHQAICLILRKMDDDAAKHWGLEDYGWYARPDLTKPMTEWEWIHELHRQLPGRGFRVERRVRYPLPHRGKCDLVLTALDGRRIWIEVRGAWKAYWASARNPAKFRSDLRSLRREAAALSLLDAANADGVGILLLGFDEKLDPMVDEVRIWAESELPGWMTRAASWPATHNAKKNVRVWFWTRPSKDRATCP